MIKELERFSNWYLNNIYMLMVWACLLVLLYYTFFETVTMPELGVVFIVMTFFVGMDIRLKLS